MAVPDQVTPSVSHSNGTNTITWSTPNNNGSAIIRMDIYENGNFLATYNQGNITTHIQNSTVCETAYYYQIYSQNGDGWQILAPNSNTVTTDDCEESGGGSSGGGSSGGSGENQSNSTNIQGDGALAMDYVFYLNTTIPK